MDIQHPRNIDNKPYGLCEAVLDFDTGYHCCGKTSSNPDTGKMGMGVGITLYFKFLKYLICFFLLFTIISIPSIYFSSAGENSLDNFIRNKTQSYQEEQQL